MKRDTNPDLQLLEAAADPMLLSIVLDRSGSMNVCLTCPQEESECDAAPCCSWNGSSCDDDCFDYSETQCGNHEDECGWDDRNSSDGGQRCRPATTRWVTAERAISSVVETWNAEPVWNSSARDTASLWRSSDFGVISTSGLR